MQVSFSPDEIASMVQPRLRRGSTAEIVRGIAGLDTAGPGDLSFLGNAKYRQQVPKSRASVILLPAGYEGDPAPGQLFFEVDNPSLALARVCTRIEQTLWPRPAPGIHRSAFVAPGASVSSKATVGPLCVVEDGASVGGGSHLQAQVFIGRGARVGADCWLMPGSIVTAECILHDRVRLNPGCVVGSEGFGYEFVAGRHEKLPQVGFVEIASDVEIGAGTTLDRARFSRTYVGEGTKIDNLVQVAHNVVIGRHCLICAQVGISGSTTLEDYVVLGGQAGLVGHVTVGKGTKVGAQAGINRDIEPGSVVNGTPCLPYMLERRIVALQHRLPEFFQRLKALEDAAGGSGKSV